MLKLLVINAHWYNRGDEAALRAMLDELLSLYPDCEITVALLTQGEFFPQIDRVKLLNAYLPAGKRMRWEDFFLRYVSKGKLGLKNSSKVFIKALKECDLVIHAPGGPALGDIYLCEENDYIARLMMVKRMGKPYMFYAPSMGPFNSKKHQKLRKKVIENAEILAVRESKSANYLQNFSIHKEIIVTRDSAFQHSIDYEKYSNIFYKDEKLQKFISEFSYIVGMTITDLQWNPQYTGNTALAQRINTTFQEFIKYLYKRNIGILFIPQLFGKENDYEYMSSFSEKNCYILPVKKEYDCYFQQYIIGNLNYVVGMRYHSNIFSAKMGIPFISIAYEQKMSGFMENAQLSEYCIDINELNAEVLRTRFEKVEANYIQYKRILEEKIPIWKQESYQSTELINKILVERNLV